MGNSDFKDFFKDIKSHISKEEVEDFKAIIEKQRFYDAYRQTNANKPFQSLWADPIPQTYQKDPLKPLLLNVPFPNKAESHQEATKLAEVVKNKLTEYIRVMILESPGAVRLIRKDRNPLTGQVNYIFEINHSLLQKQNIVKEKVEVVSKEVLSKKAAKLAMLEVQRRTNEFHTTTSKVLKDPNLANSSEGIAFSKERTKKLLQLREIWFQEIFNRYKGS